MTGLHIIIIPLLLSVIVLTNAVPFRQYIQKYNTEIDPINENLQRNKREAFGYGGYYTRNLYDDGSDYDGSSYDTNRYDGPARPTYHYTPIVKYVEHRHKRHKFFVPNLWG